METDQVRPCRSVFASDPSKAYFERFALVWAPASLFGLLVGVFGSGLYVHCGRREYLAISLTACLPGLVWPVLFPCDHDANLPFSQRFWVKAAIWIAIFSFYGNYFWTHYFYTLLGAQYLFDSYTLNDVPIVCYLCTYFYFTFYFAVVNIVLRALSRALQLDKTQRTLSDVFRRGIWMFAIILLAIVTAVFEAVTVQHFPLYTYKNRIAFLTIGSVFYGIYFMIGFPMFFSLDEYTDPATSLHYTQPRKSAMIATTANQLEPNSSGNETASSSPSIFYLSQSNRQGPCTLWYVAQNSLAAVALVTLLLDLWRLFLGDIDGTSAIISVPFIYRV